MSRCERSPAWAGGARDKASQPVPIPASPQPCPEPSSPFPHVHQPGAVGRQPLLRLASPHPPPHLPPQVELEEGRHLLLVQQQTRAQRVCHLLTYVRINVLIGLLVVGAISAIFWATKYSQDNKEVPGD